MRLALAQINPTVGDLDGNREKILQGLDEAREAGADLVLFPELAVTGYPPEDLLLRPGFIRAAQRSVEELAREAHGITALVGAPYLDADLYNACFVLAGGEIRCVYRKRFLPNYGVFDEDRYFPPGRVRGGAARRRRRPGRSGRAAAARRPAALARARARRAARGRRRPRRATRAEGIASSGARHPARRPRADAARPRARPARLRREERLRRRRDRLVGRDRLGAHRGARRRRARHRARARRLDAVALFVRRDARRRAAPC